MRALGLLSLATLALLAACATPAPPVLPPPVVATIAPPPPVMPTGGYLGMKIPAKRVDGRYVTPNIDMTAAAAVWHLRGALNVAALTCDAASGPFVTAYNSWIRNRTAVLGTHMRQYSYEWEKTGWGDWRAAYDNQQTRLYNFYTQPAIRTGFCAVALPELQAIEAVPDAELPAHARAALARIDQPFIDFYTAFDRYQDYYVKAVKATAPPVVTTIVAPPATVATTMQSPDSAAGGSEAAPAPKPAPNPAPAPVAAAAPIVPARAAPASAAPPQIAVAPEVLDQP